MVKLGSPLLAISMVPVFAFAAGASTIVTIPPGTVLSGGEVSAQATFTVLDGSVDIVLENLQANPKDIAQNLSDLAFAFSTDQTSGTLDSSSGTERTVASDGTFMDGSMVATGWVLENAFALTGGTGLRLHLLGTPTAPTHTIIGPPGTGDVYSNANASIAGNGPHNPYLAGPVTFNVSVPGLLASSQVTAVRFSFGTSEGTFFETSGGGPPTEIPEPGSLTLVGIGAALLVFRKRLFALRAKIGS